MLREKRYCLVLDVLFFGLSAALFVSAALLRSMAGDYIQFGFYAMELAVVSLDVGILIHSAYHIYRDIHFLVFVVAYNILLIGRIYFNSLYYRHKLLDVLEADSWENLYTAMTVVSVGLLAFVVFYYAWGLLFQQREKHPAAAGKRPSQVLPVLRQLSKFMLYVSAIPYFYVMALTVMTVLKDGYTASFTKTIDVPGVISRLSAFFVPSFAVYAATLPKMKEMRLPLAVYMVYMMASLLTGRRNMLVTEALMLLIYFVMRDRRRAPEKRYLHRKNVLLVLLAGLAGAYLLQVMAYKRAGRVMTDHSIFNVLLSFMDSQGASFRVVMQTVNQQSMFDQNITWMYLLYPFELFAHNNLVIRSLFGLQPIVEVQNEGFAQTTHNFAHVITYRVDPIRYEGGGGFGTSFVAEAYVAGGILMVILLAIGLALLFRYLSSMLTRSWSVIAFGLLAFRQLVYLPRSFAFHWVTDTFSITNLLYFAVLYVVSLLILQVSEKVRQPRTALDPGRKPEEKPTMTKTIGG